MASNSGGGSKWDLYTCGDAEGGETRKRRRLQ